MRDYQESVTTGQTDGQTDRHRPDKVIPMCRYASQATQNVIAKIKKLPRKDKLTDRPCKTQMPKISFQEH